MAGLKGNVAWLGASKQTAKGTAAASMQYKVPFSGGNIQPVRDTDRLSETDALRDQGPAYITTSGVEGAPEFYVRDGSIGFFLSHGLGTSVPSGTTNYTHVITPGNTLPYLTFWRNIGDTLWERFEDCMISSLEISAEAGAPLSCTANVQGRRAVRLTSVPFAGVPTLDTSAVYNFNNATVTLGGGATALVRSFELTVDNNVERQQTDDVVPYDVVPGQREISLGFDLVFETLDEYNKFHYGGAAGTAVSSNIYTTSANFVFDLGVNNSVGFDLPSIAYEEFPIEPDPGGDPIVASVRAVAQRTGSDLLTATVKNQVATYPGV